MSIKQVLVLRDDLGMRKGKMVAQGAHASLKVFFDRLEKVGDSKLEMGPQEGWDWHREVLPWIQGSFAKICVRASSEESLLDLYRQAQEAGLPCAVIQDSGQTEFHGVPTYTALAIGPAAAGKIDPITGQLKLL